MLYYGIGAYASGLWIHYVYKDPIIALLIGVAFTFGAASLIGLLVTRVKGPAFALLNMALNQVGLFLVISAFADYTRGEDGLMAKPSQLFGVFWLNHDIPAFIFVLVVFFIVFVLLRTLMRSSYGTIVKSISENETRVKFLGYNTIKYKWITFVIASTIAGVAGTLFTLTQGFVTPNTMSTLANADIIFAVLIGGAGSLYGAIAGGVIYMLIKSYLPLLILNIERTFSVKIPQWEFWLGIVLLIVVFTIRTGVVGIITNAVKSRKTMKKQGGESNA
jgi:branched-chain amino acid transport system permease protein